MTETSKRIDSGGDTLYQLGYETLIPNDGKVYGLTRGTKGRQSTQLVQVSEAVINNIQGSDLISVVIDDRTVYISSKTFVFEQGIPAKDWVIVHNLGKKPSIVTTYTNGQMFKTFEEYIDENQVIIRLDNAATGFAYLN